MEAPEQPPQNPEQPPCGQHPPIPPMGMPHPPFPFPPKCMGPKIRKPAPPFSGMAWDNGAFKEIKLEDYKGRWLVLFFYPFDFTFVCPTEICAFSDASDNFNKLSVSVLGVSGDSHFVHREFALRERKLGGVAPLKIPLLSDLNHKISRDYGCYIPDGDDAGACFRATYIIDPEGILRHMSMNDTPVGRSVDEIMRLIQAFEYTKEHGEVCPSNWKPGRKTMKPEVGDPSLKNFFENELAKQK